MSTSACVAARGPIHGGHTIKRLRLLVLLMLPLLASSTPSAVADSARRTPTVPPPLQVPAGQELVWEVVGVGVQVYDCRPSTATPSMFVWTFREPAAGLYDHGRHLAGIHYRGPTWESFDGSTVVGAVVASMPAPRPGAVAWLLLQAVSNQGDGVLSSVDYVQRLDTKGGVAPAGTCDPTQNSTLSVPYRALYLFYAAAA